MKLSANTFAEAIDALHQAYMNWELPDDSITVWKNILALSISDELLLKVVLDWILNKTTPPKNPAELIKHGRDIFNSDYDNADTAAQILIDSARNAYYTTDDFLTFADEYEGSFAAVIAGKSTQDAYIIDSIREHSSSPNILIMVFDEVKGDLKDCFTGDAEHGIEYLRTHIKKSWNAKLTDAAKVFLTSGETDLRRLLGDNSGNLEA